MAKDNDLYDFYEWNINDKIEVLNYLPVIKISFLDFYKIKRYKVSLNEEFVNLIKKIGFLVMIIIFVLLQIEWRLLLLQLIKIML